MAKRKAAKTAKSAATRGAGKKPAKLETARSVVPDEGAARPVGEMSSVEIGHVAGNVWELLSRQDGMTLAALKKEVSAPAEMVIAAIGWLAREDKLEFTMVGRGVKVSLR
jgi:hypothetical protein